MTPSRPSPRLIVLLLGALSTISPFSIDMYLPAFGQIAAEFATTPARVSLSVGSYFIGLAVGQVIYGPLLDRFGRKKPLAAGLCLYALACIGCAMARDNETLIALRFLQALGGCAAQVAAMAMVRDFFPREETSRVISMLMLVIGVSPLLAPSLGGLVAEELGWQAVFHALAVIAAAILAAVWTLLPEPHAPDPTVSLRWGPVMTTFGSILRHPQFFTYAVSSAFSFAGLFVYVAGSPVIFMEHFQVSPGAYGAIFAFLSLGFIGGSQANVFLSRRISGARIYRAALLAQTAVGVAFLLGVWNGWVGLEAALALFFLALSCLGLIGPNGAALALAPFTRHVGSASSLIGLLQIGIGALASCGVGLFNSSALTPMIALLAGSFCVAAAVLIAGERRIPHAPA